MQPTDEKSGIIGQESVWNSWRLMRSSRRPTEERDPPIASSRPVIPSIDPASTDRNIASRRLDGFTFVELISVLVILGTLAAVAVPRFVDLSTAAHRASVGSTAGAFRSALTLARAGCIIRSWAGKDNLPGYAGGNVDFNNACYPTDTGNSNRIGSSATRCRRVWNAILAGAPTITNGASGADYRARARNQVCTFLYLLDTSIARQFTYDSRTGLVVLNNP